MDTKRAYHEFVYKKKYLIGGLAVLFVYSLIVNLIIQGLFLIWLFSLREVYHGFKKG